MSTDEQLPTAVGLFELLSENERRMLAKIGGTTAIPAGQILFQTGEPGGTLYVVESGKVEIYLKDHAGQKILLKTAECGDFFGEVSLFDARARTATAVAAADCRLLALRREVRQNPETALGMLAAMGGMIRAADKLLQSKVSRNVNEMMENTMSPLERATDWVAWFSGSLQFLALTAVWFAVWIAVNTLPLGIPFFDPFPFGLLTMIVSLEAIFLSCFVLISQNRQAEKDHLRSDVEYEINIKAEMEIAHLHEKTDRMNEAMLEKFERLESILIKKS
jgi:CRP/FNR family transcriptional regulator, cyclic AMP receptor protein